MTVVTLSYLRCPCSNIPISTQISIRHTSTCNIRFTMICIIMWDRCPSITQTTIITLTVSRLMFATRITKMRNAPSQTLEENNPSMLLSYHKVRLNRGDCLILLKHRLNIFYVWSPITFLSHLFLLSGSIQLTLSNPSLIVGESLSKTQHCYG